MGAFAVLYESVPAIGTEPQVVPEESLLPSPLAQRLLGLTAALSLFVAIPPSSLQAQTGISQSRITQAVDANKLTMLKGNTHPLARPEFDRGEAPASLRMERMLLVFEDLDVGEAGVVQEFAMLVGG